MSKYFKKPPICEAAKVLQGLQSHKKKKQSATTEESEVTVLELFP
jgi:hypothetical protein